MGKYGRLVRRMVNSADYWAQAAMRSFVRDIDRRMRAQDMSRAALAQKLETSPAYITKVMRGDVNFTLETMTKLALAVGGRLQIQVVDHGAPGRQWTVEHDATQGWKPCSWRSDRRKPMTAAAYTEKLELNLDVAANQPEYEKLVGRAA